VPKSRHRVVHYIRHETGFTKYMSYCWWTGEPTSHRHFTTEEDKVTCKLCKKWMLTQIVRAL